MKRSFLTTLVFGLVAAALYFFAVEPAEDSLRRGLAALDETKMRHATVMRNLSEAPQVKTRLRTCETNLAVFADAMIVPLLESTAMRAKSTVDPFALAAGLGELDYESLPVRALPVPKRLPMLLHARCPIRIVCRGTYQAAVSFLLRIEKELPLVILQSFKVQAGSDPDSQKIEMILEWPIRGGSTKPTTGARK